VDHSFSAAKIGLASDLTALFTSNCPYPKSGVQQSTKEPDMKIIRDCTQIIGRVERGDLAADLTREIDTVLQAVREAVGPKTAAEGSVTFYSPRGCSSSVANARGVTVREEDAVQRAIVAYLAAVAPSVFVFAIPMASRRDPGRKASSAEEIQAAGGLWAMCRGIDDVRAALKSWEVTTREHATEIA
jgi:hypothetical protein